MAFRGPWGNSVSGQTTTGASLGVKTNSPRGEEPAVKLTIENTGVVNALDVSFDGGSTYPIQIPALTAVDVNNLRTFEGSMGDEVFVKAAAGTTDVQWWAHGGSP